MKRFLPLLFLSVINADSPITSTDFYKAYLHIPEIEEAHEIGVSDERIEELKNEYKEEKDTPSVEGHSNVEFRWVVGKCDIDDDTRDYIITEKGKNFINKDGVCEDCLSRKDEIDTMEYWKLVGLPQSGFSMCQYGCGCKLVEVKK